MRNVNKRVFCFKKKHGKQFFTVTTTDWSFYNKRQQKEQSQFVPLFYPKKVTRDTNVNLMSIYAFGTNSGILIILNNQKITVTVFDSPSQR